MDKRQRKKLLFVSVILILVLIIMYSGLQILESTVLFGQQDEIQTTSKVIVRDGKRYYPRQDITVILMMGINQTGKVEATAYNEGGAADMVMLIVFDEKTEECSLLVLNRDMMVDMPMLNTNGKQIGVFNGQLAYSHTYGDGMADSCENVRKTVSGLFYGLRIDYYFSMNMDAIALLNDAVGGVKVTVVDDFSAVDPDLPMGEVLLTGQQAVTFVQTRWNVGDELNLSRMERHKTYMNSFFPALREKMEDNAAFAVETYEAVSEYIVTNCSLQVFNRLVSDYQDFPITKIQTVQGENTLNGDYYEYYADEDALDALILEMFYAPK